MVKAVQLYYDGAWQDVAAYEQEGWKYSLGPSEITGSEPNTLEVTLANDDLSMDPSNVTSPLYKKIGPNTQTRLLEVTASPISASDTFNGRTVASGWGTSSGGQVWTNSGGSASDYSVSSGLGRISLGTLNVSRRLTLAGSVTGGDVYLNGVTIDIEPAGDDIETTFMFHYQDGSNYLQASIFWDRDGRPVELQLVKRLAGVVTQLGLAHLTVSPAGASYSCSMRVQWWGNHMRMKAWPAALAEPVTWNLSARDTQWGSGQIGIRANLQPLFSAGVPRVVTFDSFSYAPLAAQPLALGEASSWRPERSSEHQTGVRGRSWTGLTADGIQRRIGRWDDSAISPLTRQISSYGASRLGHWPLEDAAGAKNLANLVTPTQARTGGAGIYSAGVELAAEEGPAGALAALTMKTGERISGRFIFDTSTDGYQICWGMRLDALPGSGTYIAIFQWSDTMGRQWYWRINNVAYEISVYDDFSTLLATAAGSFGATTDPTQWTRYRIKVSVSGNIVSFEPAWYTQDAINTYGVSGSFINVSVGYPIAWAVAGNSYSDNAGVSHVFGTSNITLDLINTYDAKAAFDAYNGETTAARFIRLTQEVGLSYRYYGAFGTAAVMGRQPRASMAELLEEIAVTEGGVIWDDVDLNRLAFRLHDSLVNQTPILALTRGVNLGYPLKKVIDDTSAANDITVTNWDGTNVQLTKNTGTRSVQAPPLGVGRYQGRLEVSFRWPEALEQRGNFELVANTLDRPRYPSVVVDLLANPSLRDTVGIMRPGDLITLAGEEPDTIYLIVVQIERVGNSVIDKATLSCIPAEPYMAGKWDDGIYRYDSRTTTTAGTLTTTSTSLAIKTTDPLEVWRTAGSYDITVEGERMTVTSCTTAVLSGGTYNQTMTVARSVNGVVKSHVAGEEVHVFLPARYKMTNREPIGG